MDQEEIQKELKNIKERLSSVEKGSYLKDPNIDPNSASILGFFNALKYFTAVPTYIPRKETDMILVKTGGLYYIYTYVDGAWRKVQVS